MDLRLMGMEESRSIDEQIREYDKLNSSNLAGFIEMLRMKKRGENLPLGFFHIGKTGSILNQFGISGDLTANKYVLDGRRHSKDDLHNLSEEEWLETLENINDPIAISRYRERKNGYRIYTQNRIKGKNVCVGLDINSIGRNVCVAKVSTVFGRDLRKLGKSSTEKVLYKKEAAEEFSSGHNPQIYPQSPISDAKV